MRYSLGPGEVAALFGLSIATLVALVIVISIWSVVWKGFVLWYAARGNQKWWFIALLVINTAGILEIIYFLFFRPKSTADDSSSAAVL